ncbi:MAG: hypothetical protein KAR20_17450, partial [Candidatus Heimdallarchaeota archaeon]|nr:hypothetical protein [Candidatus Heimdallarchaeota archaeon]
MLKDKNKIKTIVKYSMLASIIGIIVVLMILFFSSFMYRHSFTSQVVKDLYANYNIFYLINLVPVLFGIAGGLFANSTSEKTRN